MTYSNSGNKRVIIDFGANKGQNIDYYLLKSEIVVCVEANPELVREIKKKYIKSIQSKKLFIENVVVTGEAGNKKKLANFYIHKKLNVLSSAVEPTNKKDFFKVKIKSKSITEILDKHLTKNKIFYFAKFDLEGYDAIAIKAMFKSGFYPINISTEMHTLESLEAICNSKKYVGFKLQEGNKVSRYSNLPIITNTGTKFMTFIRHSAGPMGEDIPNKWLTEKAIRNKLKVDGLGWKDVHASMLPNSRPEEYKFSDMFITLMKRKLILIYQFLLPFVLRDNPTFRKFRGVKIYSFKNK